MIHKKIIITIRIGFATLGYHFVSSPIYKTGQGLQSNPGCENALQIFMHQSKSFVYNRLAKLLGLLELVTGSSLPRTNFIPQVFLLSFYLLEFITKSCNFFNDLCFFVASTRF